VSIAVVTSVCGDAATKALAAIVVKVMLSDTC